MEQHYAPIRIPSPKLGGGRGRGLSAVEAPHDSPSTPTVTFNAGCWIGALLALLLCAPIGGR